MSDRKKVERIRNVGGRPSFWRLLGYQTIPWRLPRPFADNDILRRHLIILPGELEELIRQYEPRKQTARGKETYQQLIHLRKLLQSDK